MVDVSRWLAEQGLGQHAEAFAENGIAADILRELTDADLKELGLNLGDRKRLLKAIAKLHEGSMQDGAEPTEQTTTLAVSREAERRQLTVMFVDMVGSTALSTRLDPEEMREVIRAYQDAVAGEIARFEGHVARFMGDGVLAYFGWPRAHEDEAERAVHAGLAVVWVVGQMMTPTGEPLAARVGIATGLVVVGDLVGEGATREDVVVGETPNLAARLQALAAPGAVLISQATRRLLGGLFELSDLGPQRLKGFAEPLTAWRVEGEGRAEGRFEALHGQRLTPLVGRAHELGILLERWAWARDGEGQVVLLAGEPGIGKSRLVRTLRGRLGAEPYTPLSHYCSTHHTSSPLHPVIGLLERAAGIDRGTPSDVQLAKLEAVLTRSSERPDEVVPLLAALLGVPTGERYPALDLTPEAQKRRTLQALVDQLAGLAAEQPVLALYEDVHWIDPSSLELLGLVIERIRRLPVLVLITFRPEFQPPWTAQAHVTTLTMSRLGRRQGADLVARVTGDKPLPAEIVEQIVARTDGVPLFVEELTKTVLESGLLADAGDHYELSGPLPPLAIPETLHGSLMARLDRLPAVKEIAQLGAVIGREFSQELLAAVADRSERELHAALDQLAQSGLIFRRGAPPETIYSFKHALVRDAAYQLLLKPRRQQLHARIAEELEERFRETMAPELLAGHCIEAGLAEKAVDHLWEAGRRAFAAFAAVEVIDHLRRALDLLEFLPHEPERELDITMILAWALITTKGSQARETVDTITRAEKLCPESDERAHILKFWQFLCRLVRGTLDLARETAEELLGAAQKQHNATSLLIGYRAAGTAALFLGNFGLARDDLKGVMACYDAGRHDSLASFYVIDPRVVAVSYRALAEFALGYPVRAETLIVEALKVARELSHRLGVAHVLYFACPLYESSRDRQDYEERMQELTDLCASGSHQVYAAGADVFRGWVQVVSGQTEEGLKRVSQGLQAWRTTEAKLWLTYWLALSAEAHWKCGDAKKARRLLAEAMALTKQTKERWFEPELHRRRGELLLTLSGARQPQAEVRFRRAIEVARAQEAKLWELRAATSLARLWCDQGRRAEAHDLLAPVYGWFTEGFDTADLRDAKALLDELTWAKAWAP